MSTLFFIEKGEKMEDISKMQEECVRVIRLLRQNQETAIYETTMLLPKLIQFLQIFLKQAENWNALGGDLPLEVILQQIKNLNEAYCEKDVVVLADTLEYEIMNSFEVYEEIV